jgi:hypothetical protein
MRLEFKKEFKEEVVFHEESVTGLGYIKSARSKVNN